jgi:hypothetical protein
VVPVGEHRLKISTELFHPGLCRIFFAKVAEINDVPPVTLFCL